MSVLSPKQLQKLWVQAGGDPSKAGEAAAIAMAESSGNYLDENHNTDGSIDLGEWQINNKAHPTYNQQQLHANPLYNAKAAVAISNNGTDWSPWVTFKNGAYKKYLSGTLGSARASAEPGTGSQSSSGGGILGDIGLGSLEPMFEIIGNPIRAGKIILGGVLLFIAIDRLSGIKAIPTPIPV